jgi:hypothetical protein
MKVVTSSRRQLVMAVLLVLATVGAAMRHWAADPSLLRDIGTLLLVLWLPAVGNLVAFVVAKLPRRSRIDTGFAPDSPFNAHLSAELTPLAAAVIPPSLDLSGRRCTLVVGPQGFTARLPVELSQWLSAGTPQALEFEFLRPEPALRALPPGTQFHVAAGSTVVGKGRVTGFPARPGPPAASRSAPA